MHNLTALSLALPGTPLHGLDEFEARRPSTSPLRTPRVSRPSARAGATRPQAARRCRFVARRPQATPTD